MNEKRPWDFQQNIDEVRHRKKILHTHTRGVGGEGQTDRQRIESYS